MSIELTDQQQQALAAAAEVPPRVIDPRTYAPVLAGKDELPLEDIIARFRMLVAEAFA
jgi:hypothetical protein